ncbi:MAG: undecaprenyl-diphosphate phosphatase [Bacteroidales bacterium]|nr:undecaprenyl-diphosphate phosphatase [Bacteroidales bacterium]
MDWLQALLLGILQGIAEFLPISSDGHLELGKAILNVEGADNLLFTIVVHGATVLATLIIFWREIMRLLNGTFKFRMNEETEYVLKLIVSMIPVGIVGFLMKDWVESFFNGDIAFVGAMLLLTAAFLYAGHFLGQRKQVGKPITYLTAFIMGIAQAIAVMPGLSRSGTTIATGMMLGVDKKKLAEFSFLMVIVPILGANALELKDMLSPDQAGAVVSAGVGTLELIIGFIAAFFTGLFACSWMIKLVKRGKLIWFAVYCTVIGGVAIAWGMWKA